MNQLIASRKRAEKWVCTIQLILLVICIILTTCMLSFYILNDLDNSDEKRFERAKFMEKQGEWWGYCFLVLTFFLITSVIVLVMLIWKGKNIGELPDFKNEAAHLTWILVIFVATYLLRSISDILIVPKLMKNLEICTLKNHPTLCASF